MTTPNRTGFVAFIRNSGITPAVLPDTSTDIDDALTLAIEIVSDLLAQVSTLVYEKAVYNLGVHNLIVDANDQSDQIYKDNLPYFAYYRQQWKINVFSSGVVASTGDEGTNVSMDVPEAFKRLSIADLQYTKTPWGMAYLSYAQRVGSIWGST